MRWWWSLGASAGDGPTVVVDAEPAASWEAVARLIGARSDPAQAGCAAVDVAAGSGPLHASGAARSLLAGPTLLVRGGPCTGVRVRLSGEEVRVGSGADDVQLRVAGVRAGHLLLRRVGPGRWSASPGGEAEVLVDGAPCVSGQPLAPGAVLQIGSCLLGVDEAPPSGPAGAPLPGGARAVVRPLRHRDHRRETRVVVPAARPAQGQAPARAWVTVAAATVVAVLVAVLTGRPPLLLLGLGAPLAALVEGSLRSRAASRHELEAVEHRRRAAEQAVREVHDLIGRQRQEAWQRLPDAGTLAAVVSTGGRQVWERRSEDADALHVRVGTGVEQAGLALVDDVPPHRVVAAAPVVAPVPVAVDLRQIGVLGVVGDPEAVGGVGRALVVHLAALRSPRDLALVLICGDDDEAAWRWSAWLPHLRGDGATPLRMGTSPASRAARVRELQDLLARRRGGSAETGRVETVVVIDTRTCPVEPGLAAVLSEGPALDVRAVVLGPGAQGLPLGARLDVDAAHSARLTVGASPSPEREVLADGVPTEVADSIAASLAPLVHVGGEGDEPLPPDFVRLADLIGPEPTRQGSGGDSAVRDRRGAVRIVLGAAFHGPVDVDLGGPTPHLLVGGGLRGDRRAVLRVCVVGLALAQAPGDLLLALLATEPASAFGAMTDLPHLLASPSGAPLRSPSQVVAFLQDEVARRRRLLQAWQIPDVSLAWARDPHTAARGGLGRLVVAVDEASMLTREHPEAVPDLAQLARIGRGCGLHLLLSDERPEQFLPADLVAEAARVTPVADPDGDGPLAHLLADGRAPRALRVADLSTADRPLDAAAPVVHRLTWATLGEPRAVAAPAGAPRDASALVDAVRRHWAERAEPRRERGVR